MVCNKSLNVLMNNKMQFEDYTCDNLVAISEAAYQIKWKTNKYHAVGTVPKIWSKNRLKQSQYRSPKTNTHRNSFSCFGTWTSKSIFPRLKDKQTDTTLLEQFPNLIEKSYKQAQNRSLKQPRIETHFPGLLYVLHNKLRN